jgi:hypothetical protein
MRGPVTSNGLEDFESVNLRTVPGGTLMKNALLVIEGENIEEIVDFVIETIEEDYYLFKSQEVTVIVKEEWHYQVDNDLYFSFCCG